MTSATACALLLFLAATCADAIVLRGSMKTTMRGQSSSSIWHYEDQQAWAGQCTAMSVQQAPLEFHASDVRPLDYAGGAGARLAATKLFFKYGSAAEAGSATALPTPASMAAEEAAADEASGAAGGWLGGSGEEEEDVNNGTAIAVDEQEWTMHMSPQGVLYMSLLDAKLGGTYRRFDVVVYDVRL